MGRFTLKTERNNFTITLSPVDLKFQHKVYNVVLNRANFIYMIDRVYQFSPLNLYSLRLSSKNIYEDDQNNKYTSSNSVVVSLDHKLGLPKDYRISEDPTFSDTE